MRKSEQMSYLIDRQRALRTQDIVAVLSVQLRQRHVRSRVVLSDNSLYHTLTRSETLVRHAARVVTSEGRKRGRALR